MPQRPNPNHHNCGRLISKSVYALFSQGQRSRLTPLTPHNSRTPGLRSKRCEAELVENPRLCRMTLAQSDQAQHVDSGIQGFSISTLLQPSNIDANVVIFIAVRNATVALALPDAPLRVQSNQTKTHRPKSNSHWHATTTARSSLVLGLLQSTVEVLGARSFAVSSNLLLRLSDRPRRPPQRKCSPHRFGASKPSRIPSLSSSSKVYKAEDY